MERKTEDQANLNADLQLLSREKLIEEVIKLRDGIRKHRDASGHDLCWHHPELWNLLPEKITPEIAIPEWSEFIPRCAAYRRSLDQETKK